MSAAPGSRRYAPEKLRVACSCGKRYRVPARRAGSKLSCKACGAKVRIPWMRSPVVETRYTCLHCKRAIASTELAGSYLRDEIVCRPCQTKARALAAPSEPAGVWFLAAAVLVAVGFAAPLIVLLDWSWLVALAVGVTAGLVAGTLGRRGYRS